MLVAGTVNFGMTPPERMPAFDKGGIVGALNAYGVPSTCKKGASRQDIVSMINANRPPILLVRSGRKYWHYIVAVGYTGFGNKILIVNPSDGKEDLIDGEVLDRAWSFDGDLEGGSLERARCRICDGNGSYGWTKCPKCSGTGKLSLKGLGWTKCLACSGRGKWSSECHLCKGTGKEADLFRKAIETLGVRPRTLIAPDQAPPRPRTGGTAGAYVMVSPGLPLCLVVNKQRVQWATHAGSAFTLDVRNVTSAQYHQVPGLAEIRAGGTVIGAPGRPVAFVSADNKYIFPVDDGGPITQNGSKITMVSLKQYDGYKIGAHLKVVR